MIKIISFLLFFLYSQNSFSASIKIEGLNKLSKKDIGVSISCDGVCLTLITIKKDIMEFYLSKETIERSKFRYLKKNEEIK